MNDDLISFGAGFIVALIIFGGSTFGILQDAKRFKNEFHQQAIEHGAAEYNKTTGQWQWIEKYEVP